MEAGFCPQHGLWFHFGAADNSVAILTCQTADTCTAELPTPTGENISAISCQEWLGASGLRQGAICSEGAGGFLCSVCEAGYNKIEGVCLPCESADWLMVLMVFVTSIFTALFLLHKSTRETVSADELAHIWYKVDVEETGLLDIDGLDAALRLTGVFLNTEHNHDDGKSSELERKFLNEFGAKPLLCVDCTHEGHCAGCIGPNTKVRIDDFVRVRSADVPTGSLGTMIFFCQTFSLLAAGASETMNLSQVLNMDSEKVARSCIMPLNYMERYVVQTVVQPVFVCVSLLLAIPIWNLLRRKIPARLVELDLHVPPRVDNIHLKRAFLNVFLFLFAPLTRLSIEAFVCRDTCSETADTADCGPRLVFDLSVTVRSLRGV